MIDPKKACCTTTDSGKSQLHKRWRLYASHLGNYMRRWIARWPLGTARIHNIMKSDAGRDHHDHPFDFYSLILWGGYLEHRPGCLCFVEGKTRDEDPHWREIVATGCRYYGPGSIVRRKAEDYHRLELVNGPAWTFVITGPYRRTWGFLVNGEWIHYKKYHEMHGAVE